MSFYRAHPPGNRKAQCFAYAGDRNPIKYLLEEPGDNQLDRLAASKPA
jgi:hypothetical protein